MTKLREMIEEEAIGWIIRIRDPYFDDWDLFSTWMEDPARARVYSEMAAADADVAGVLESRPASQRAVANVQKSRGFWPARRTMIGWAVAASIVAVVGFAVMPIGRSPYMVATRAGERKAIRLEDGSRIDLNGDTRLVLDHGNARYARLESGEANFSVVHDASKPFLVEAGGAKFIDAGTAFNVTRIGNVTEVAVSDGLVIYNPRMEKLAIEPGRMIHVGDGQQPIMSNVDALSIASWREGRLIYNGARLAVVAADLTRNLGVKISVSPQLSERRISAVILIKRKDSQAIADIGALLGLDAKRLDDGWQFSAAGNATR